MLRKLLHIAINSNSSSNSDSSYQYPLSNRPIDRYYWGASNERTDKLLYYHTTILPYFASQEGKDRVGEGGGGEEGVAVKAFNCRFKQKTNNT